MDTNKGAETRLRELKQKEMQIIPLYLVCVFLLVTIRTSKLAHSTKIENLMKMIGNICILLLSKFRWKIHPNEILINSLQTERVNRRSIKIWMVIAIPIKINLMSNVSLWRHWSHNMVRHWCLNGTNLIVRLKQVSNVFERWIKRMENHKMI